MLTLVLAPIGLLAAFVLFRASRKPDTFTVSRSIRIAAPASIVHSFLEDFRMWRAWSPYEKLDPEMQRRFSGPERGTGAAYEWEGKGRAGAGRMVITSSAPARVALDLELRAPFRTRNAVTFTISPAGAETELTWAMRGPNRFLGKVMQTFVDMDRMVGRDFEAGLASLKTLAERQALAGGGPGV